MTSSTRYWCHICNTSMETNLNNEIRRCNTCNSEFVEEISFPGIDRFESIRFIFNDNIIMSSPQLQEIYNVLRDAEDRNIMELRTYNNMNNVQEESFENDSIEIMERVDDETIQKMVDQELHQDKLKEDCLICHDNFEKNNRAIVLSCNHFFHKECIQQWFTKSNKCPLCRNIYIA